MKPKTALRSFLGASMIVLSSAAAQTTYTWENSNTAEPTPTALDWFSGGDNTQGAWIDANTPVSGNTNTIQIFEDTSTALTGWTGTLDQAVVVNHGSILRTYQFQHKQASIPHESPPPSCSLAALDHRSCQRPCPRLGQSLRLSRR